jgi:hypothetical protein
MLFSLEQMWNRHSVRWRSRRSRSAYGFERDITLNPTVGSPSNLYRRFRMPFSLGVDVESPLGQVEVASLEIRVPV